MFSLRILWNLRNKICFVLSLARYMGLRLFLNIICIGESVHKGQLEYVAIFLIGFLAGIVTFWRIFLCLLSCKMFAEMFIHYSMVHLRRVAVRAHWCCAQRIRTALAMRRTALRCLCDIWNGFWVGDGSNQLICRHCVCVCVCVCVCARARARVLLCGYLSKLHLNIREMQFTKWTHAHCFVMLHASFTVDWFFSNNNHSFINWVICRHGNHSFAFAVHSAPRHDCLSLHASALFCHNPIELYVHHSSH